MSDKVQLICEEVERLKNHTLNIQKSTSGLITSVGRGRVEAFNDILKFIDSLPKESVNEDLEEAATKWDETASFQPFYMQLDCKGNPCEVKQDITTHKESFKAGAEWADKHPRGGLWNKEKVIKWILENADKHIWYDETESECGITDDFIEDLQKAMEE